MRKMARWALVLALPLSTGGCLLAAAGAGAGAAVAYSERGAKSLVNAPVSEVVEDTRAVFEQMGIEMTDRGSGQATENDVTVTGRQGETEISVEIERQTDDTSEVEVVAREGALDFKREMARDVLRRIVARS